MEKIFNQKALYYEQAIQELTKYCNNANGANATKLVWLANLGLFSLLSEYDLWVYICSYHTSNRNFVKNLYARLVCLGIVETTEDILQMMGKEYHQFFNLVLNDESIQNRASRVRKEFVLFKEENEREFREIRNYVIAHRDHDVSNQISILNKIDSNKLMEKNMDYLRLIEQLHSLINDTVGHVTKQLEMEPGLIEKFRD